MTLTSQYAMVLRPGARRHWLDWNQRQMFAHPAPAETDMLALFPEFTSRLQIERQAY